MNVLVDSSVWIDYFRRGNNSTKLDRLIDENIVIVNDLILAELIPFLLIKNEKKVICLLNAVQRVELNIDWKNIIHLQIRCLNKGINKVGIPDLIIIQNAIVNKLKIYTLDKHFELISKYTLMRLYAPMP